MAMTVLSCVVGLSTLLVASGSRIATPWFNIGVMSIMMMSSTSMTSTSGVTLMSALTPPFEPPTSIDIVKLQALGPRLQAAASLKGRQPEARRLRSVSLSSLLDEVVDELRRGVVHLHVEVL